ncbi:MAG: phytoene dehydrogenase-like protein [Myxococcota bacterium]|jgi:phytoene dehydrogenase-like protein
MQDYDVIVIGAGFGGLAAALEAAEQGRKVAICEALKYPGGCASTFTRDGVQYEAGATLFSGLDEGHLFGQWRSRLSLPVHFERLAVPIELRTPDMTLPVPDDRDQLIAAFCGMPHAPVERLRAFFAEQARVSEALWPIFDDPARLPPLSWPAVGWHLRRLHRYLPLVRLVGRSLLDVLRRHRLHTFAPLCHYLNALSQITVQASIEDAEAPFAMSTMDYCFRGTGHVRGGIGELASAMLQAIEGLGGTVMLACRVRGLSQDGGAWQVSARGATLRAPLVVANLLPQAVSDLLPDPPVSLARLTRQVESGWGAAMLYRTLRLDTHSEPHHLELIADPDAPFIEGNHVFCSISGSAEQRAPDGLRTLTASTHVPMQRLRSFDPAGQAQYIAGIQARMRQTIAERAPELSETVSELTASPRTFARFTRRPGGFVGGIPRRTGLASYQGLLPRAVLPGLYLVGDSVFPGQSTLACAAGGVRTMRAALSGRRMVG